MYVNSGKIIKIMNTLAPEHLAESWDNVGLLVGNENSTVDRILVALEVTEAVVEEAIQGNFDLIICHHPLIFKPLNKVIDRDPIGRMVMKLIKNDISVYAAHTNLDIVDGGTNDYIASLLELQNVSGLEKTTSLNLKKITVFVPVESSDKVRNAMTQAGAGAIGNYSACTFNTSGIGTFMPMEGASPFIGEVNNLETVEEIRIEAVVHKDQLSKVVSAMIKAHPYEVPAYDIIELENEARAEYLGRTGFPSEAFTLEALAEHVKKKLGVKTLRYIGNGETRIRKVALCSGAGSDLMKSAVKQGCDTLITGDVKYHEAQTALQMNLTLIDAGHFETEQIYVKMLTQKLTDICLEKSYEVAVVASQVEQSPFKTL